jgi:hypothetical protein
MTVDRICESGEKYPPAPLTMKVPPPEVRMTTTPPTFKIGDVVVDLPQYASGANAVFGIKDSGKTVMVKGAAEHLMDAGVPIVAFDPTGVWRFLRVPGAGKGYRVVVVGGQDGDFALSDVDPVLSAAVAQGVSVVIDLSGRGVSKADWKHVVVGGIKLLMDENKTLRHVFLEEAPEFAPQTIRGGAAVVYGEVEKLVRIGGNHRLGVTLISQRTQELNKAVLELCDNLVIMRQKGFHAIDYLGDWMRAADVNEDNAGVIGASLAKLPTGECWVWLRERDPVRTKVALCRSFHPNRRLMQPDVAVIQKASVDVSDFVASLKAALAAKRPGHKGAVSSGTNEPLPPIVSHGLPPTPAERDRIEAAASAQADRRVEAAMIEVRKQANHTFASLHDLVKTNEVILRDTLTKAMTEFRERMLSEIGELRTLHQGMFSGVVAPSPTISRTVERPPARRLETVARVATPENDALTLREKGLTRPQMALLEAVAWLNVRGFAVPSLDQVAVTAGWKPGGSNVKDRASELVGLGLLERPTQGHVAFTPQGAALAPAPDLSRGIMARIDEYLTNPQRAVFECLKENMRYEDMPRDFVAERLGWVVDGSNIKDRVSELVSHKVVERTSPGRIAVSRWVRTAAEREKKQP